MLAIVVPTGFGAQQAIPANTAQPTISGTTAQGQTLTATAGTWSNSPTSFAYQWMRCPASGGAADASDCAAIGGATTTSYVVAAGDVGSRFRIRVTATNDDGPATAASNATDLVTATAPGPPNTQPPTISGQAVVGQTLTATQGTWTGTGLTFAYQWRRCDTAGAQCADISGATATTYALVAADSGRTVRVEVTAKNATGETTIASAQTAVVTTAAPPATGCPTGTGPIDVDDISAPARLQVDRQQITPSVVTPGTRTIRVRFHVSACGGRSVEGALVYATPVPDEQFHATVAAHGWGRVGDPDDAPAPVLPGERTAAATGRVPFGHGRAAEDLLAGNSRRARLVSFKVNLSRVTQLRGEPGRPGSPSRLAPRSRGFLRASTRGPCSHSVPRHSLDTRRAPLFVTNRPIPWFQGHGSAPGGGWGGIREAWPRRRNAARAWVDEDRGDRETGSRGEAYAYARLVVEG